MNILITGSSGFVGTDLTKRLINNHKVIGVDIQEPKYNPNKFVCWDLTQNRQEFVKELAKNRVDVIIHLASAVGGILYNNASHDIFDVNSAINRNVLHLCEIIGCDKFIFFSSINVFEDRQFYRHEPLTKLSTYAASKADAELRIESGYNISGKPKNYMIVRPTNIFGAEQHKIHETIGESHVIPDLLQKIDNNEILEVFGDGSQVRNFVHVSDISKFIIRNLFFEKVHYFNLRSNITISIKELVDELLKFRDKTMQIKYLKEYLKFEKIHIQDFDMTIPEKFGWKCEINSIQDGLKS